MSSETSYYHLTRLGAGDSFATDSYKFTAADRDTVDRLLFQGASAHRHTGGMSTTSAPTQPLALVLDPTQGTLPHNTLFYYSYTLIDSIGYESSASPVSSVATTNQVATPGIIPSLAVSNSGGTLTAGNYLYTATAYSDVNAHETIAPALQLATIGIGITTGKITVTLPALPAGATGFNLYRRDPAGAGVFFVTTQVGTGTIVDTGLAPNCDRTLPVANTTGGINAIAITLPGATPLPPAGFTWKLYRTSVANDWHNSFVAAITSGGTFLDTGVATTIGQPPLSDLNYPQPAPVILSNAAEVSGKLPPGCVAVFPFIVTLRVNGTLTVGDLQDIWVCEYPSATIMGVRASSLGTPVGQAVIVDIDKTGYGATPTTTSIFTNAAHRPRIEVGTYVGVQTVPDVTALVQGDALTLGIDLASGGATPTDHDVRVTVYGWASFSSLVSTNPPWV